jgi:hypothetical protein
VLEKVAYKPLVGGERASASLERLELARERESASIDAVIERLDPEAISGAEELPSLAIP